MRIRIIYQKTLPLRFTSALDMQLIWERSLRRSSLHITYSQGFHPKPKIQLGLPLPLGFMSDEEIVDIWIEDKVSADQLLELIQPNLPIGLTISSIEEIDFSQKPVVTRITTAEYVVKFWDQDVNRDALQTKINSLLLTEKIIRTKRNKKQYDLRPLIKSVRLLPDLEIVDGFALFIALCSEQNRMGRADEVMFALDFSLEEFLIKRTKTY